MRSGYTVFANLVHGELLGTLPRVESLAEAVRQSANNPTEPSFQEQVVSQRAELLKSLDEVASERLSPIQREELKDLNLSNVVGGQLRKRVEAIFRRNTITPVEAADELDKVVSEMRTVTNALVGIIDGFDHLGVGIDELKPGQVELSLLVPREAVHEGLEELGGEFIKLKNILNPFIELATGSREDVAVRTIASSDFEVFLLLGPIVAVNFARGVEVVLNIYEKVLNIRKASKELEGTGVHPEVVELLHQQADTITKNEIHVFVEQLLRDSQGDDDARRNELRVDLSKQLMELARRVDRGYRLDLDARQLPAPADDEEAEPATQTQERQALAEVIAASSRLKTFKLTGKPILSIPESTDGEREDGDA